MLNQAITSPSSLPVSIYTAQARNPGVPVMEPGWRTSADLHRIAMALFSEPSPQASGQRGPDRRGPRN